MQDWQTAVWGKPVTLQHVLKEGDRLEILRSLRVDPKVARRERFQRQGAKTAGLFAKRRVGAKPGY
jgi:putative ubiquitin-RnfH superfamily antitoxin RatB of RatAB toxin-antitoxin module